MGRTGVIGIAGIAAAGAAVVALSTLDLSGNAISEDATFTAPGLEPLTIGTAQQEFWRLTPALLLVVYDAFAETEEAAIYDTLERVTHGDALEYLYLERAGSMAGGGLDEADQTIHEIKLLTSDVTWADDALNI
ncbi:MAG: hypothetical protein AAFQ51_18940, partial [Pseudomonadota bacterium]